MSGSSRIPRIPERNRYLPQRQRQDSNVSTPSRPRESLAKPGNSSQPTDSNPEIGTLSGVDELSRNGFIKLNTHDISNSDAHVPGIEKFAEDLQAAIGAAWPTRRKSRYEKVNVLLLSWEDDNLGVYREMDHLEHVFSNLYRFDVQRFKIPRKTAGKATTSRILSFLEDDGPETLFIVYYAGHARLSRQSNEPPIWSATDSPNSPTLPSGGVQQLFEEAESDVLLLYDTCHSSHPAVNVGGQGVTEVIAACGFETEAPAVGPHSFTNALIRELEEAFTGPPISVAELHGRIIGSLKSWKPRYLRDRNGYVWTDEDGQPKYECHKRRTPVHCFLTNEVPYRSIMLAPLSSKLSHSAVAEIEQSASLKSAPSNSLDSNRSIGTSDQSTAPTSVSESLRSSRGPQVLLAIRLEDDYLLNGEMSEGGRKFQAWCNWIKSAPDGIRDIKIQGIYKSFSTLVLISIPVVVWDILPENAAYSFVGFVQSGNLAHNLLKDGQSVSTEMPNTSQPANGTDSRLERKLSAKGMIGANRDSGFSEMKEYSEDSLVTVTDATGQRHKIPYQLCQSWGMFDKAMKATFSASDNSGRAVHQGHYQILDERHTVVLPQTWNKLVFPGSSLTMRIWQAPVLSKPLTPPPVRAISPSPRSMERRPLEDPSFKRQRTLKRRAGFVLPKSLHDDRPPSPEESSDEMFEPKREEALERKNSKSSHPHRSQSPHRPLPQTQLSQKQRSNSSPPLTTSRNAMNKPDTSRYATWDGFSKSSNLYGTDKIRFKTLTMPARAKSLQGKVEKLVADAYAPRRSRSEASEEAIARAVVHRLRKEKGYPTLKSQYSGSTLGSSSRHSRPRSG